MTQISRPWAGTSVGDAGTYSDLEWQQLFRAIIGVGAQQPNSGVVFGSDPSSSLRRGLEVVASSPAAASVVVRPGTALVNGTGYINDADVTLAIAANGSGNPRIDTIVLRKSFVAQTVRLAVVQGTAAASPVPPALTQTSVTWEIPLADIEAASGFSSIVAANILPTAVPVNGSDGDYLFGILNNSAGILRTGDVVKWDTGADRAVTTTTTANDSLVAGVWVGTTAPGSYGRLQRSGVGLVRVNAAVARGVALSTSTTAKQAQANGRNVFAFTLEAAGGAGLVQAVINLPQRIGSLASYTYSNYAAAFQYSTISTTYVEVDTTNLKPTLPITTGIVEATLTANMSNASITGSFTSLFVDGVEVTNGTTNSDGLAQSSDNVPVAAGWGPYRVENLLPGNHIFSLVLRATTGTARLFFRQFHIKEVPY